MGTVNKLLADRIIAGEFARSDGWPVRIVEYTTQWGDKAYGVEQRQSELGKYSESEYVINPTVYWQPE